MDRCLDWGGAKVGCHGEVGDGSDEEGDSKQVVEDLLASLGKIGETDHNKERQGIDCGHSPKPIRAIGYEVEVSHGRVDPESIIGASDEDSHFDGVGGLV